MSRFANREERVSAWLDGAMTPEEQAAFAADLERDDELAALAERLTTQDRLVGQAFPLDEVAALDPAFLERMGLAPESAQIIDLAEARELRTDDAKPHRRLWPAAIGGALAAGLATFVLFGLGSGDISRSAEFASALDRTPSREIAELSKGRQLAPVLSFESADGRYCREFALTEGRNARSGIACKSGNGWRLEAWGGPARPLPDSDAIVAADGASDSALDKIHDRLGASDPLGPEAEATAIGKKWMKAPE